MRTDRGFTLVEVMVSLAIMGIVVTVAFSGLSIGLNGWERGSNTIDRLDRRGTIERLIRQQLMIAYPMKFVVDKNEMILFRGSRQRIEFVSDYSLADGNGDFRKIDYLLADGHFWYGETPLFGYVPRQNEIAPSQQLGEFRSASFRYLAVDEKGNTIWLDDWSLGMGIPRAVQIRLDDDAFLIPMVNR